jgi:hypothetical protein
MQRHYQSWLRKVHTELLIVIPELAAGTCHEVQSAENQQKTYTQNVVYLTQGTYGFSCQLKTENYSLSLRLE